MSKQDDSLDFTPKEPGQPAAAAPKRRKKAAAEPVKAPPRKIGLPVLIAGAIIVAVVFFMARESSKEVAPPPQATKPAAPASKAPPASKPSQPYPPPVALPTPPQTATQSVQARALPAEFLAIVQQYNTKAGFKAMALALDADGKWAYGSITGWATQPGANEEALAECEKYKTRSGAQSSCRLFATGDKVVW